MSISVGYKREKKQLSKTKAGDKREVKQMIIVKTYRGHIRNWEELCERLGIDLTLSREEREHEILIKAYQTWGCEMADHMHGMFAFALWDEEEQKLFCLRDQFGTKPFYYYETEDGELLYGTMIRDIIDQPGFKKELNEEMLQLYLSLTYVAGENTFFRGLKKLLPGRYLIWQDGKLEIHRYWKPEFHPDESKTLEDWADEIHNTLKEIMPEVKIVVNCISYSDCCIVLLKFKNTSCCNGSCFRCFYRHCGNTYYFTFYYKRSCCNAASACIGIIQIPSCLYI